MGKLPPLKHNHKKWW